MGIFMFSLTGFPPLGGFFGKLAVFAPAVEAGLTWLAILGVLASVLSAYYYLRVLFVFWMRSPKEQGKEVQQASFSVPTASAAVIVACAGLLIVIGFVPWVRELTQVFFDVAPMAIMP